MTRAPGRIITFYSYKGGTGRTMALANVACLLAEARVLVVDWDLEAPGLHRFFPPRLRTSSTDLDMGLDDGPGLIDLFAALRDRLPASPAESEDEADRAVVEAFAGVTLDSYIRETTVPGVHILRAGRNDDGGYSRRVGTFDWEGLFTRAPGIYRGLAERLAADYGYVLIDSRTGVTDISGICTYLLPEQLVVVFTPNRQSLTGVHELVERATAYRRGSDDLRPLLVFPLPSRIEASLQDLRTRWRLGDPERNIIGYQPMFQDLLAKCYGLKECDLASYFDDVQIQQTPDYAYGEEIAVRRTGDRFSMANSYGVFVRRLISGEPPWARSRPEPAQTVSPDDTGPKAPPAVTFRSVKTSETFSTGVPSQPQVFLSHAPADTQRIAKVQRGLVARGLRVTSVTGSGDLGADFGEKIAQGLDASSAVVVFWSRDSVESQWVRTAAEEGLRRGILVPVLLDDVQPPIGFRNVSAADLSRASSDDAVNSVAEAVHRLATGTPGTIIYQSPIYQSQYPPTPPAANAPAPATRVSAPATRSGRTVPAAIAVAAVVALLAGGTWLYTQRGAPSGEQTLPSTGVQTVTVPNFVGTASGDVAKTAGLIGLTVSMSDGRGATAPYLEGVVTSQNPAPGTTVARSSRVDLQIATRTVQVPTLVGTTLNSALTALEKAGLRLGKTTTRQVSDARPGTILRQTPEAAASVAAGSSVEVVVAAAIDVTVPNVVGMYEADATATLKRAGLEARVSYSPQSAVDRPGRIVIQKPAGGTRVRPETAVEIIAERAGTRP